jgi:hypothetical protein
MKAKKYLKSLGCSELSTKNEKMALALLVRSHKMLRDSNIKKIQLIKNISPFKKWVIVKVLKMEELLYL